MYLDLFKGLGLKNQDLAKYNSLLVSFDGRVVIPQGQISLRVSMEGKDVTDRYFQIGSRMEEGDKIKVLLLLI